MNHSDNLVFLTLTEAAALVKKRKVSPVELVDACLACIEALNPKLNAFITICAESARAEAKRAEREIARRKYRGPLHGIPIAIKDNIYTKGIRTTAGSKILADFVPDKDAWVVESLKNAGAIILGKTNLHEFAYGVTTENPHYGTTRNPWDTARIAGGSSGGSAVAVATGMCFGALGTDTGGSIRIPASLCGIVGFKLGYNSAILRGVIELSKTLDHVGPLARNVEDAALLFNAIALKPKKAGAQYKNSERKRSLRGLRVGVPRKFFFERIGDEVAELVEQPLQWFASRGAKIREAQFPFIVESEEAGNLIAWPEATAYHTRMGWWPGRKLEYGEDVRKRLEMGSEVRAADYLRAMATRRWIQDEISHGLPGEVDFFLTPTTPIAAPLAGEKVLKWGDVEETVRAALLRFCRPANLTGSPAISLPCGFTRASLPVGLQLIAADSEEKELLQIAREYEQAHEWHTRRPPA